MAELKYLGLLPTKNHNNKSKEFHVKGNINLYNRPIHKNEDGSISTVLSMSFGENGKEILVPKISDNGQVLTDKQAIDSYHKTGRNLGKFNSIDEADKYAEQLHKQQEQLYLKNQNIGEPISLSNNSQRVNYLGPLPIKKSKETPVDTSTTEDIYKWTTDTAKGLASDFYTSVAGFYGGIADVFLKYPMRLEKGLESLGLPKSGGKLVNYLEESLKTSADVLRKKGSELRPKNQSFMQELIGSVGAVPTGGAEFIMGVPYSLIKGFEEGGVPEMVRQGLHRTLLGAGFKAAGDLSKFQGALGLGVGMGAGAAAGGAPRKEVMKEVIVNSVLGWLGGGKSKLSEANQFLVDLADEGFAKGNVDAAAAKIDKIVSSQPGESMDVLMSGISEKLGGLEKHGEEGIQKTIEETLGIKRPEKVAKESASVFTKEMSKGETKVAVDKIFEVSGKSAEQSAKLLAHPAAAKIAREKWASDINDAIEKGVLSKKEALDKVIDMNLKLMELDKQVELSKQEQSVLRDKIENGQRYAKSLSEEINKSVVENPTSIMQEGIDYMEKIVKTFPKKDVEEILSKKSEMPESDYFDFLKEEVSKPRVQVTEPESIATESSIKKIEPSKPLGREEKINSITLEEAGKMIKEGNPEVVSHIKKGIEDGKVSLEKMQDAIRNETVRQVAKTPKNERPGVVENIKGIEPEINQALKEIEPTQEPVIEESTKTAEARLGDVDAQIKKLEESNKKIIGQNPTVNRIGDLPKELSSKEKVAKLLEAKKKKSSTDQMELDKLIEEQKKDMEIETPKKPSDVEEIARKEIQAGDTEYDIPNYMKNEKPVPVDQAIKDQWAVIDRKLSSDTLRGGVDPTLVVDLAKVAYLYMKKGSQSFESWSKDMIDRFGKDIKPFMRKAWDMAQESAKDVVEVDSKLEKFGDPTKIVKQREIQWKKKGKKYKMIPVYEAESNMVKSTKDLPKTLMNREFENPIRTWEQIDKMSGTFWKDTIYRKYKRELKKAKVEFMSIKIKMKLLQKGLGPKSSRRIGAYAIAQQENGVEILKANKIRIPELSKREFRAYEGMREVYDGFYERVNNSRILAGKQPIKRIENYFTLKRIMDTLVEDGLNLMTAPAEYVNKVIDAVHEVPFKGDVRIHPKATPWNFIKRSKSLRKVDLDSFNTFRNYTLKTLEHIYISPVVAKGREMIGSFDLPDGNTMSLASIAPRTHLWIEEWLDAIAGKKQTGRYFKAPPIVEKGFQKLNRNLAFAILSGNVRAALIQPTALVNTAAAIGFKHTWDGIVALTSKEEREKAIRLSNTLLLRDYDVSAKEAVSATYGGKLGKAKEIIGEIGLKPLQFLDMQTAIITWIGAHKKALSEGMSKKDAIDFADDVVTRTQGSAAKGDLAPIQRTVMGKTFTMFQTFTINQWGFLTKDLLGKIDLKKPSTMKDAAAWVMAATMANVFYDNVVGVNPPTPTPIKAFIEARDEGKSMAEASRDAALEIVQLLPLLGGLRYGSSMFGAPIDFINDVAKKVSGSQGITKPWWDLVGNGFGIPLTNQAKKAIRNYAQDRSMYDVLIGTSPKHRKLLLDIIRGD